MSMNLLIFATHKTTLSKPVLPRLFDVEVQPLLFNAIQTPTWVTKKILASASPLQAYVDWVLDEFGIDSTVVVFAEDDIFEEGEPIGIEVRNPGKQHVDEFLDWVKAVESMDYVVKFEMM